MAALESRDLVEKSNISFYEACTTIPPPFPYPSNQTLLTPTDTRLADRSATQQHQEGLDEAAAPTLKSAVKSGAETQVRQDLSAAQQMRADLQSRLTATTVELEKTKAKSKAEGRRMHEMNTEQNQLVVRLRDRDAEIRGKAKLLEVWII